MHVIWVIMTTVVESRSSTRAGRLSSAGVEISVCPGARSAGAAPWPLWGRSASAGSASSSATSTPSSPRTTPYSWQGWRWLARKSRRVVYRTDKFVYVYVRRRATPPRLRPLSNNFYARLPFDVDISAVASLSLNRARRRCPFLILSLVSFQLPTYITKKPL